MPSETHASKVDQRIADQFEKKFSVYKSSRLARLQHGHVKLLFSKFLELLAKKTRISFRRKVNLIWGTPITIVYPDATSIEIARYGCYEEGLTKMVLAHVKPGAIFLDVGAHIGYYSLLAAWLVGEAGQVHSFEPTPSTFDLLRRNTQGKSNIYLNQIALSNTIGETLLNDYGTEYMGSNSRYEARMDKTVLSRSASKSISVHSSTIDNYVDRHGIEPNFVKIDAESSEFEILKGMTHVLENARPIVALEVGDMDIAGVPASRDLIAFLNTKGYQAYEFADTGLSIHQIKHRYTYDNILFIPDLRLQSG